MSSLAQPKFQAGMPCACGCGVDVKIDGLGSALSESVDGTKVFFATESCRMRWREKKKSEQ